jgi:hypothetical protein
LLYGRVGRCRIYLEKPHPLIQVGAFLFLFRSTSSVGARFIPGISDAEYQVGRLRPFREANIDQPKLSGNALELLIVKSLPFLKIPTAEEYSKSHYLNGSKILKRLLPKQTSNS